MHPGLILAGHDPPPAARWKPRKQRRPEMSKIPLNDILLLVAYLETDEGKHWHGKRSAGEDTSNHIFNSVKAVSDWLDTQPGMITAAEREQRRLAPIAEAFAKAGVACDGDFADFWNAQDAMKRH
jgi:hypothetical protein